MRKALLLLLVLSFAMAEIEVPDGCTRSEYAMTCDKQWAVENAVIQFTEDVTCTTILEFEGCYAEARLVQSTQFEACKVYMPLLAGGEVDYDKMDQYHNCKTKTWQAGQGVTVLMPPEFATDCKTTAEDDYTSEDSCAMNGQQHTVNATVTQEDTKYMDVVEMRAGGGFDLIPIVGAVVAIIVIVYLLRKSSGISLPTPSRRRRKRIRM